MRSERETHFINYLQFMVQYTQRLETNLFSTRRRNSNVDNKIAELAADDTDVDHWQSRYPPVPNTDRLDKNDISLITKQACGEVDSSDRQNQSVVSMVQKRAVGSIFSIGERCRINNGLLPNKMDQIDKYSDKVYCCSYSKDGKYLLTAGQDKWLRVYHIQNGKFVLFKQIRAQDVGWSILDAAFSPDGNTIVYSSWSDRLYECPFKDSTTNQKPLYLCPDTRRFCVYSLVYSNDGRDILGGSNVGYFYMYNRERQQVFRIKGHEEDVNAVTFADDTSQIIYSGSDDGLCKVWDKRTLTEADPRPVGVLAGHMDGITYIDSRGDKRYLITNSKDQTIKLWDVRAFSSTEAQRNTLISTRSQKWDYRWMTVPARVFKMTNMLEGDTSVMTYRGHCVCRTLIRCRFSPAATTGQRYIYTGCASGRAVIYDLLTGKMVRHLSGHGHCIRDLSWHPYHSQIVTSSWDHTIARWSYSSDASVELDKRKFGRSIVQHPETRRRSKRIAAQRVKRPYWTGTF